jgi:glycosyltransferase involved in cell wall biosynthesis
MRILYLHQYFRKPSEGGALRSYYLSKALVHAGHTVELITSWNGNDNKTATVEGINVHYLPVAYENKFGVAARLMAFFRFGWQSAKLAFNLGKFDLCFATSTPLTIGIPALLLKKLKGTPYYFEVRDLWPEAPIQLGYIKNPIVKRLLTRLEKVLYCNAAKIIALSPGMVAGIKKHEPAAPVYLIPNMADCEFFHSNFTELNSKSDSFLVAYTGTLGRANRVESLLEIALACQEKQLSQIRFVIAGSGAEAEKLQLKAKALQLNNVEFTGQLNRNEIRDLLNRAAATFTSFDTFPVLETNSPNKFFDSLAAGKLTIVNTKGWLRELVEENYCGFYTEPRLPETFTEKIIPFLENNSLLRQYQQNARKLAESRFSRKKLTEEFVALFKRNIP